MNQCEKKDVEMETEEKEGVGEEKCLGSPSISGWANKKAGEENKKKAGKENK